MDHSGPPGLSWKRFPSEKELPKSIAMCLEANRLESSYKNNVMNTIEIESRKNEGKNQNETKDGFDLDDETVDFRYLTD